jgi:hypothetical protein
MGELVRGIQTIALDYNVLMIEEDTKIQNVNIGRASEERISSYSGSSIVRKEITGAVTLSDSSWTDL